MPNLDDFWAKIYGSSLVATFGIIGWASWGGWGALAGALLGLLAAHLTLNT